MEVAAIILTVLLLVIEFFLGNTKLVKENSIIAIILKASRILVSHFKDEAEKKADEAREEVKEEKKEE